MLRAVTCDRHVSNSDPWKTLPAALSRCGDDRSSPRVASSASLSAASRGGGIRTATAGAGGGRAWVRIWLISSRVRYVDPGSLMECPWYRYVSSSMTTGPCFSACALAYVMACTPPPSGPRHASALDSKVAARVSSPVHGSKGPRFTARSAWGRCLPRQPMPEPAETGLPSRAPRGRCLARAHPLDGRW